MPERSKGSDLRSFVLSTRGFKSLTLQIFDFFRFSIGTLAKILKIKREIQMYKTYKAICFKLYKLMKEISKETSSEKAQDTQIILF